MRLALVGATGAVGGVILALLEESTLPIDELVPVASARSAGRLIGFKGEQHEVRTLSEQVFEDVDVALFDVPDSVSRTWAPVAVEAGGVVVDNSAAWRMEPGVPLVVPEINPEAVGSLARGIIASPNCTTLAVVVPLAALHRRAGLRRLILASYQAVSGAGQPGITELWDQLEIVVKEGDVARAGLARELLMESAAFPHPIALNFIPQAGSVTEDGYTSEEVKLCSETRKILDLPDLPVTATCVRVPVVTSHGVAVHAEFAEAIRPQQARTILEEAPGVEVRDDPAAGVYPTALEATGRNPCFVGRIRQDRFDPRALELFCAADNLRKGAALNTVQIAELLLI